MNKIIQKILHGYAVLETANSKINGQIEMREDILGRRTLVAGGLAQSGKEVKALWSKAMKQCNNRNNGNNIAINNCLILGLGAGTVAKLLSQKYPGIKITGIEIDSEIIRLGKKYFGLDKVGNLEIQVADAISIMSNETMKQSNKYDLILVDLYLGNQYPLEAESLKFLKTLKNLSAKNGLIIFNRLYYYDKDKKETDEFRKTLKDIFNQVEEAMIFWNKFYFCG